MSTVITVENLGKKYLLSHQAKRQPYVALRDVIAEKGKAIGNHMLHPFSQMRSPAASDELQTASSEDFWALKDVSFEIKQGERVGIIGRNGAGKSTLLKILSRIVEPTTGRVKIKGRVASLLEVGTGFHPELTGRENIFLNGAILGMTKVEIKKKFDEIVDFAEIEKFLDTPVKRYSSGMYVRLAFAVAAHLEPEILLVDEVLAVGDMQFQKKCLGKMEDVGREGRTVLFVSHNMAAVERLCESVLLFSKGLLEIAGDSRQTIASYLRVNDQDGKYVARRTFDRCSSQTSNSVRLKQVCLLSETGEEKAAFCMNESFHVVIVFEVVAPITNFHLYAKIHTIDGILAFSTADWDTGEIETDQRKEGEYSASFTIPGYLLNSGDYMMSLDGLIPNIKYIFQESNVLAWEINSVGGVGGLQSAARKGVFRPLLEWNIE